MSKQLAQPQKLAITAIFTALVCVTTMIFSIYVPQTRGYFNIGEGMVYITALLFGPVIGSFAGGVGSMLSDLLLGYAMYAPATLIIKAIEGGIVGVLSRGGIKFKSKGSWQVFTLLSGLVVGALLTYIGSSYYSGNIELYFGIPPPVNPSIVLDISPIFWYLLGFLATASVGAIGFMRQPELGRVILAVLMGGLEMVAGYYCYEQFFMGVFAAAEIPINIGQMIVGLTVAIPVAKAIKRVLPNIA